MGVDAFADEMERSTAGRLKTIATAEKAITAALAADRRGSSANRPMRRCAGWPSIWPSCAPRSSAADHHA